MKKTFLACCFAIFSFPRSFADSFTDILQDLAIQTACIGKYSATQAGGGWYDDPADYYTPDMMAERLKNMSGNMTRTTTFYGVCFDYAEFAYWDIVNYRNIYNKAGMDGEQYFLAGVDSNPNIITLSSPTSRDKATRVQNGVYVKTYGSSSYRDVKTHKMLNGTRATHHAWLWVMRNDGVWFWIDPTWTDNLGYVVYGYVSNDEEIQLRPDEKYCSPFLKKYPDYLKNLPSPPSWGKRKTSSYSNTSTASSNSTTTSSSSSSRNINGFISIGYMGSISDSSDSYFINWNKCGLEISTETLAGKGDIFAIFAFDYIEIAANKVGEKESKSWLLGFDWGYGLLSFFQPYFGGSLGMKWEGDFSCSYASLAWKVSGGVRIPIFDVLTVRGDIS